MKPYSIFEKFEKGLKFHKEFLEKILAIYEK